VPSALISSGFTLMRRRFWPGLILALLVSLPAGAAFAQSLSVNLGTTGNGSVTTSVVSLIAITTVLSVAPGILVVATAFTRLVVVLSLLRTGMGLQQSPPNTVIVSLAMFLTAMIMAPTFQASYTDAIKPLMDGSITEEQAAERAVAPFRHFMEANVRDKDVALFVDLSHWKPPPVPAGSSASAADIARTEMPLQILAPAFLISELSKAFQIGFLLFLPFLVIDIVVSSILMGMGMMMLPPVTISLPFKLIFFVLVDGWELIVGSLVRGFSS
jgi:flagellar biosynthesis protein FliP